MTESHKNFADYSNFPASNATAPPGYRPEIGFFPPPAFLKILLDKENAIMFAVMNAMCWE